MSVLTVSHFKKVIEEHFPKWRMRKEGDALFVDGLAYKIRVPAREYLVGWTLGIKVNNGQVEIIKREGWNLPSYGKSSGVDSWPEEKVHKALKRKAWGNSLDTALEKLKKASEFDVKMPNGLIARWDAWGDEVVGWGELPKKGRKKNLARTQLSWKDFLIEQEKRHGKLAIKNLQKKLILTEDPHPVFLKQYDTDETKAYRKKKKEFLQRNQSAAKVENDESV